MTVVNPVIGGSRSYRSGGRSRRRICSAFVWLSRSGWTYGYLLSLFRLLRGSSLPVAAGSARS